MKKQTTFLLFLLLIAIFNSSFAQDRKKIDSLLKIVQTPKMDTITVYAYCDLSAELVGIDNEQAKTFALKGLEVSNKIKNKKMQAWANHVVGMAYDYAGIAEKALSYYEKSIQIKKILKDVEGEASTTLNIGVMYYYQKDYDASLRYSEKALELYKNLKNEKRMGAALNNIGAIYRLQKKYDDAIKTYNYAYELKEKTKDTIGMSNVLANLGIVYQHQGNFGKAEKLMLDALSFQQKKNDKNNQINMYGNLAALNIDQKKYLIGRTYLKKAMNLGEKLDMPHEMKEIYKLQTQLDSISGDYKSAYIHLTKYNKLSDEIAKQDRQKELDKLETVYRTKEKESEIELGKTIISNRTKSLWIVAAISTLLLGALIRLLFLRIKIKRKNIELKTLVTQKEDLVKEIHHRVKNNLQVISSLLNLHVRKVQDPESKKIFDDGISRIQAMSLIHENIYADADLSQIKPRDYIEKLIEQLYITYQIPDKAIKITTSIDDMNIDIEKLMSIGLILNEILSNAFKYAFKGVKSGTIDILMHQPKNSEIELIIKDSGKGLTLDEIETPGNSLGMRLIKAFSDKLKAVLSIGNIDGTVYKFTFDPTQ